MATTIQGSGDSTFGGTIQSTGIDDNATSTAITIDSSENVGIGTSSPSAVLEVMGVAPSYTQAATTFWGGTTNNDNHNGIMLSSYGNALGGSVGSNLTYANSATPSQTSTARSSGEIQFENTTAGSRTSDIKFGGYYKGTTSYTERMRIDSSGRVTMPNQPAFSVRRSSSSATSTHSVPDFDTINHNIGSHYNLSTDRFTAPVSGVYSFSGHVIPIGLAQNSSFELWISINSTSVRRFLDRQAKTTATSSGTFGVGGAVSIYIAANDYVQLVTTSKSYADEMNCFFSGQLIG